MTGIPSAEGMLNCCILDNIKAMQVVRGVGVDDYVVCAIAASCSRCKSNIQQWLTAHILG